MFKVATWNVNSLRVRLPHVLQWLQSQQPDVLALQETKVTDEDFPAEEFRSLGYQVTFSGQKSYNGVALLSRTPAEEVLCELPDYPDPQRRVLCANVGDLRVMNLYVPNGQSLASPKYAYKLDWLAKLIAFAQREQARHSQLVLLGDFNIAPEDRDVHDPEEWQGTVLTSEPERAAFRQLLEAELWDSFRLFEQPEKEFSWWDYRMNAFRRNRGMRIDHILISNTLKERCAAVRIDREPRRWERPSDHTPVIAEFDL